MVFDRIAMDVRLAVRTLSRSRGFSMVAVLILALAIGVNGAVFGLLNAVLRTPPTGVKRSPSLVWVAHTRGSGFASVPIPYFRELRAAATHAIDLAAAVPTSAAFASTGEPVRATAQLVSANFFSILGISPAAGRLFAPHEDRPETEGRYPVVVLSHDFWKSQFREDRGVVGKAVSINGQRFDVVGVAAPGFVGVQIDAPAAFWVPLAMRTVVPAWAEPRIVGSLRERIPPSQAGAVLQTVVNNLREDARFAKLRFSPTVMPLAGWVRPDEIKSGLPMIAIGWVIAAIVLLVVVANIANLMLVRAVRRRREIGVRIALGGPRSSVIRLLVIEAVVLAVGAGTLGVLFAFWGAALFRMRIGGLLAPFSVTPDTATIAFTFLLSVIVGAVFGAAPAWRASRPDVVRVIKGDHTAWLRRGRLQATLVIVQVSLSVILVVATGLFVRRLSALAEVQPGFDAEHTVTFSFDPYAMRYSSEVRTALYERINARLAAMPGIASVTVPTFVPLGGGAMLASAFVPGSGMPLDASAARIAVMSVGPGYFSTLRIRLIEGRDFTARDMTSSERVAVVSESFARARWPNERAVGKRFGIDTAAARVEVIGVARDVMFSRIDARPFSHAYVPYTQGLTLPETHVVVRTQGAPVELIPAIRAELRAIDPTLPMFNVRTLEEAVETQVATHRSIARVLGGFATLALLFASLGLYGIVAFAVSSRTREIGIRLALGAQPGSVVRLFVREGLTLSLVGVAVGGVLSIGAAKVLNTMSEGLELGDPATIAGIALVLTSTALLASWLSARRAGRVDPMVALRAD